jgi:CBS domain containing-hemolysin-like protein
MIALIITVAILILGSAFCSSAEAALFSLNISRVEVLVGEKKRNAKLLLKIKQEIEDSVGAIVVLNNFFNIVGTLIAGVLSNQVFSQGWQIVSFTVALTISIILFGEILPKNFGDRYALSYSLAISPVIQVLKVLLRPLLWIIQKSILGFWVEISKLMKYLKRKSKF